MANFAACTRGLCITQIEIKPIHAWPTALGDNDFDLVTCLELVAQWNQLTLNACASTAMTNVGVDMIGKINRGRAFGQIDNIPFGGEGINTVFKDFGFHTAHE